MTATSSNSSLAMDIGFFVVPEFPAHALILATETLRVANQLAGKKLLDWHVISIDGNPVESSNGLTLEADLAINDTESLFGLSLVIVCFGNHPMQYVNSTTVNCLRRIDKHDISLGAMDTGIFALADAGLLEGHEITLHWEAIPIFEELYPDINVLKQIIVVDRNRITCSGGIKSLDMMLHIIGNNCDWDLAQSVANAFVHGNILDIREPQREAIDPDPHTTDAIVELIVSTMENNVEILLTPEELALQCRTTVRRMERIFRRKFDQSPMRFYLNVRLQKARQLLLYSNISIGEISLDTGFSSLPLFSRTFKQQFGHSPRQYRANSSSDKMRHFYPEYVQ